MLLSGLVLSLPLNLCMNKYAISDPYSLYIGITASHRNSNNVLHIEAGHVLNTTRLVVCLSPDPKGPCIKILLMIY